MFGWMLYFVSSGKILYEGTVEHLKRYRKGTCFCPCFGVAYVSLGGLSCHDGTCEIVDSNIEIPESSYFAIFFGK